MEDLQWLLLAPFVAMIIILLVLHGFPAKDLLPYTNQSKSNWQGTSFPFPRRSPSFDLVVFVAVASLVQFFYYVLTVMYQLGTMFKRYLKLFHIPRLCYNWMKCVDLTFQLFDTVWSECSIEVYRGNEKVRFRWSTGRFWTCECAHIVHVYSCYFIYISLCTYIVCTCTYIWPWYMNCYLIYDMFGNYRLWNWLVYM